MEDFIASGTAKIEPLKIGRDCIICRETIILYDYNDPRMICPECLKRLKEVLYPERCN